MSEIKVNSIKGVGASAAAITVNNSDGTCTANITNRSNRNIIINGAMQVAQRGTSSSVEGFLVDRFIPLYGGIDEVPTQAQVDVASGTTPYTLGFRKALKITNGNQTSGAGTNDNIIIQHRLEGQDIANSGWNYLSTSSNITLSFWVKSSVAQNFYFAFISQPGTQKNFPMETGSLSADTWTKITKTIPGNSGITINNDNALGLLLEFMLFRGTDKTGSVNLNEWSTYSGSARTPDQTSTWYTTNDATFEITGVQLEVGSVATDFEFRSFGQELDLCKRYFQILVRGSDGLNGYSFMGVAAAYSSVQCEVPMRWEKEMRGSPSLEVSNGTNYFTFTQTGSNAVYLSTFVAYGLNRSNGLLYQAGLSGLTTGKAYRAQTNNNSAYIYINAEL